MVGLSKARLNRQVTHRTEIVTERIVKYISGGVIHPFEYRFTVTLDDGSTHTLTGQYPTDGQARNAAQRQSERIIERGWEW